MTGIGYAIYTESSGASASPSGAPISLHPLRVVSTGDPRQDLEIVSRSNEWRSKSPLTLSYSWLSCDLHGAHCVPVAGLRSRQIVPPQQLQITTLRGVVTATNAHGSQSVVSSNFYFDHAGIPLAWRGFSQFDPLQLRQWYGLRPGQDGAGQTIVITELWHAPKLQSALAIFDAHYGLPPGLKVVELGGAQSSTQGGTESELDVEWAHAIAPKARIVVLEAGSPRQLLDGIGEERTSAGAHVFSASWCAPCQGELPGFALVAQSIYRLLAIDCHAKGVVCTFPSGDTGGPGVEPTNSPYVLAAGGSEFRWNPDGSIQGEREWPNGGGGVTDQELPRPSWQKHITCSRVVPTFSCKYRAIPDVSATAEGAPTVSVRKGNLEWHVFSGTSLSSPLWAALIALTDQELAAHSQPPIGIDELHQVLYRGDVSSGLNDLEAKGWDWVTGVGSPKAGIVDALAQAIERYRAQTS